jgi:hypothetical protein
MSKSSENKQKKEQLTPYVEPGCINYKLLYRLMETNRAIEQELIAEVERATCFEALDKVRDRMDELDWTFHHLLKMNVRDAIVRKIGEIYK